MRLAFTVTEVGVTETLAKELVCALGNESEYLVFSRGSNDDRSVEVQYSDESHRDRNCIRSYLLSETMLSVQLSRQLGDLVGVKGFDITLALDAEMIKALDCTLRIIFDHAEKPYGN